MLSLVVYSLSFLAFSSQTDYSVPPTKKDTLVTIANRWNVKSMQVGRNKPIVFSSAHPQHMLFDGSGKFLISEEKESKMMGQAPELVWSYMDGKIFVFHKDQLTQEGVEMVFKIEKVDSKNLIIMGGDKRDYNLKYVLSIP